MRYSLTDELFALRLTEGEELHASIAKACQEYHCDSAVVLGGLGMVRNVTFGWFTGTEYLTETHDEIFELAALSGDVSYKDDTLYPHLHMVVNRRDHSVLGGHCLRAVVDHNMEVFLKPVHSIQFRREFDGWFAALAPAKR